VKENEQSHFEICRFFSIAVFLGLVLGAGDKPPAVYLGLCKPISGTILHTKVCQDLLERDQIAGWKFTMLPKVSRYYTGTPKHPSDHRHNLNRPYRGSHIMRFQIALGH